MLVSMCYTVDPRSMAFLRSYVDASHTLALDSLHNLAAVDCFDWTDVCAKNNVTVYPTVRIYRKDKDVSEYKGLLGAAVIVSTVKL